MAAGLNKVTIIGNLGHDPEVRFTQGGTAVCNLRVGVTERRKSGDEWQDHTEWFTVVCFGKTAENAGRFLKKGRQIYADGRLQSRTWEDREGQKRYNVELIANQVLFLGNRADNASNSSYSGQSGVSGSNSGFGQNNSGGGQQSNAGSGQPSNAGGAPSFVEEEDIPF